MGGKEYETHITYLHFYLYVGSLCILLYFYLDFLLDKYKKEGTYSRFSPKNAYGNLYLKSGAILFGVFGIIYCAIEFTKDTFVEEKDIHVYFSMARSAFQMAFIFAQMVFIFSNQNLNIFKHNRLISYFGLMHMIATNLCLWLNVLIIEASHAHDHDHEFCDTDNGRNKINDEDHHKRAANEDDTEENPVTNLLQTAAPFLFPCKIEYSLICAAMLFVMWRNIDEEQEHYKQQKAIAQRRRRGYFLAYCLS